MKIATQQLTFEEYPAVRRAVQEALAAGDTELDFSGVSHVDSTAVSLVLFARQECEKRGTRLHCVALPESYEALVKLYGLESLAGPETV